MEPGSIENRSGILAKIPWFKIECLFKIYEKVMDIDLKFQRFVKKPTLFRMGKRIS